MASTLSWFLGHLTSGTFGSLFCLFHHIISHRRYTENFTPAFLFKVIKERYFNPLVLGLLSNAIYFVCQGQFLFRAIHSLGDLTLGGHLEAPSLLCTLLLFWTLAHFVTGVPSPRYDSLQQCTKDAFVQNHCLSISAVTANAAATQKLGLGCTLCLWCFWVGFGCGGLGVVSVMNTRLNLTHVGRGCILRYAFYITHLYDGHILH